MSARVEVYTRPVPLWTDYETPPELFAILDAEFHFTLDVCATRDNAKVLLHLDRERDGLARMWAPHVCWMNPPYGRQIIRWIRKACVEAARGALVVALLPARTDSGWWHDYVIGGGAEVRFLRGRIKFVGQQHNAPFPSAVVVYRPTGPTCERVA